MKEEERREKREVYKEYRNFAYIIRNIQRPG